MAFVHMEVDDVYPAAARRHNDGLARRALRGHGTLGVQAGEWQQQPDGSGVAFNTPFFPPLFLWSIDGYSCRN